MSRGHGAVQRALLTELRKQQAMRQSYVLTGSISSASITGRWPWKGRLSYTETPLAFCSGRLHTQGLTKYIRATLSLYRGNSSYLGPSPGYGVPSRETGSH